MPTPFEMYSFTRVVVLLALVWAVVGAFSFSRMMHYLGWDSMNVEWQMMLFGGLSLAGALLLAIGTLAVLQFIKRDRRRPS